MEMQTGLDAVEKLVRAETAHRNRAHQLLKRFLAQAEEYIGKLHASSIVTRRENSGREGAPPVLHWGQNEFAFAQTAGSGPAEANTHAWPRPDGQPAPTEPVGVKRDDLG